MLPRVNVGLRAKIQRRGWQADNSEALQYPGLEVARPEGFEPPTLCLEVERPTLPNLAGASAERGKSASCGKSEQAAFSFLFHILFANCRVLPRLV